MLAAHLPRPCPRPPALLRPPPRPPAPRPPLPKPSTSLRPPALKPPTSPPRRSPPAPPLAYLYPSLSYEDKAKEAAFNCLLCFATQFTASRPGVIMLLG